MTQKHLCYKLVSISEIINTHGTCPLKTCKKYDSQSFRLHFGMHSPDKTKVAKTLSSKIGEEEKKEVVKKWMNT